MKTALAFAEAALERGDYSQSLSVLKELAEKSPINSKEGAKIRFLMITALMGNGDEENAILICRQLTNCKDSKLRQDSKQLLSVLQSPSLSRPENWSIKLPVLNKLPDSKIDPSNRISSYQIKKDSKKKEKDSYPPTGSTRGLGIGFSLLTIIILVFLTIILSGCVKITTKIDIPAPDRIKMQWDIESSTKKILPWQVAFEDSLSDSIPQVKVSTNYDGKQSFKMPKLNSKEANSILQEIFLTAAYSAGVKVSPPILSLSERNWFIGVKQDFKLIFDLRNFPQIPGLKIFVLVNSSDIKNSSEPDLEYSIDDKNIGLSIKPGELNTIEFRQWRWSSFGLGTILVISLFLLTIILQRVRLQMGFGFPELPP